MPQRAHAADWEVGLRNQLRNTVGSAYRIGEQRGKAKLDVRFSDGTRKTKSLGIPWLQASVGGIQKAVEAIAEGVAGLTVEEALEAHQANRSKHRCQPKKLTPKSWCLFLTSDWNLFPSLGRSVPTLSSSTQGIGWYRRLLRLLLTSCWKQWVTCF